MGVSSQFSPPVQKLARTLTHECWYGKLRGAAGQISCGRMGQVLRDGGDWN